LSASSHSCHAGFSSLHNQSLAVKGEVIGWQFESYAAKPVPRSPQSF